jgi:hypothetical protein
VLEAMRGSRVCYVIDPLPDLLNMLSKPSTRIVHQPPCRFWSCPRTVYFRPAVPFSLTMFTIALAMNSKWNVALDTFCKMQT